MATREDSCKGGKYRINLNNASNSVKVIGSNLTDRYQYHDIRVVELSKIRQELGFLEVPTLKNDLNNNWFPANLTFQEIKEKINGSRKMIHSVPSYLEISLGGALATGSHGYYAPTGSISNQVLSLVAVSSKGEIFKLTKGDRYFDLLSCGYGAGAAVLAVKLKLYPERIFKLETRTVSTSEFLRTFKELHSENISIYANVFPGRHDSNILLTTINPIPDNLLMNEEVLSTSKIFSRLEGLGLRYQHRIPTGIKQQLRLQFVKTTKPTFILQGSELHSPLRQKSPNQDRLQKTDYKSHEVSFDLSRANEILSSLINEFVPKWRRAKSTYPINIRISGADEASLSPTNGRDSLWIDFVLDKKHPISFLEQAEDWHISNGFKGRPHIGKFLRPNKYNFGSLYSKFEDCMNQFHELDPKRYLYSRIYEVNF